MLGVVGLCLVLFLQGCGQATAAASDSAITAQDVAAVKQMAQGVSAAQAGMSTPSSSNVQSASTGKRQLLTVDADGWEPYTWTTDQGVFTGKMRHLDPVTKSVLDPNQVNWNHDVYEMTQIGDLPLYTVSVNMLCDQTFMVTGNDTTHVYASQFHNQVLSGTVTYKSNSFILNVSADISGSGAFVMDTNYHPISNRQTVSGSMNMQFTYSNASYSAVLNIAYDSGNILEGGTPPDQYMSGSLLRNGVKIGTLTFHQDGSLTFKDNNGQDVSLN